MDYSTEKTLAAQRKVYASPNRLGDGLRLLEDMYQPVLDDAAFSRD